MHSEQIENEIATLVAKKVKACAEEEVRRYVAGDEYKLMVENMKRRERERVMEEVREEIAREKAALLTAEREKLTKEVDENDRLEEILAENQRKIEEQKRRELEARQLEGAERLKEIQLRRQAEEERLAEEERKQEAERLREKQSQQQILSRYLDVGVLFCRSVGYVAACLREVGYF